MKRIILLLVALVALSVLPRAGWAQSVDRPLLSLSRLNVAAGVNYNWVSMADATAPKLDVGNQYSVGLYGAYNLLAPPTTEKGVTLSLVGASVLWIDSENHARQFFNNYVGLRVGLYDGSRR